MTDIQKRFDRILAIFIYLQAKPLVTAGELADKYDVSLRTIYRDIRSLIAAGVPIYGEAGSGYALVQGYRLPPLQFTKEEALSFVAAEKLMIRYTDKYLSDSFTTALYKMKAILRSSEKNQVALADDKLIVRGSTNYFNDKIPEGLSVLIESIVSKKCVHIHYLKPSVSEMEPRHIEPVGIFVDGRFWYVMAYCHLRHDYRQFRLDRIQHISLSEDSFTKEHRELSFYLNKETPSPQTHIAIRVDIDIARYLHWERGYYGFTHETIENNKAIMYFETALSLEAFARWFMMFVDKAEIVEPLSLKEMVHTLAKEGLARLAID